MHIEEFLENPIKKSILTRLYKDNNLKYSDLKEFKMDNTLFNYHLQHLVKLGYIENVEGKYSLTREGNALTANITDTGIIFPKFILRFQMYLIDENASKVLFQKWNRKPWLDNYTPISSKLLLDNPSNERANLRMKEKTGLDTDMKTIGILRQFINNEKGEFLDENSYVVAYGTKFSGEISQKTDNEDDLVWLTFEEAINKTSENDGYGNHQINILKRLKEKDYSQFYLEETVTVKNFT